MSIPVLVRILGISPYPHSVPDKQFLEIISNAVMHRAKEIEQWYDDGVATRNSFAFCLLDPTAPLWKPTDDCVLAVATIGPVGEQFLPNAIAKAFEQRDHGVDCGVLTYVQKHRSPDGDFRWGFSVNLDGTIVGGSGLTEYQDRYQCILLAAEFNYGIWSDRTAWEKVHPKEGDPSWSWYCDTNEPGERYDPETVEVRHGASLEISLST